MIGMVAKSDEIPASRLALAAISSSGYLFGSMNGHVDLDAIYPREMPSVLIYIYLPIWTTKIR